MRPLYLKASQSDLPELKRVILSSNGHVVWDETFEGALEKLLRWKPEEQGVQPPKPGTPELIPTVPPAAAASDSAIQALARDAKSAWDRSQAALKTSDWAAYGAAMADLEKALNGMFTPAE